MPHDPLPYARALAHIVSQHEEGQDTGHSFRVEVLARSVLLHLPDPPPGALQTWPAAFLVHDIGKLGVPASVLRKPGPLQPSEFALVRIHTLVGSEWLARLAQSFRGHDPDMERFWELAAFVAAGHHERPDGEGYPLGLKDMAVPLVLRLARLVDVYDALTSRRAYRDALSHHAAVSLMEKIGGFDPALMDAFQTALQTRPLQNLTAPN